MKSFQEHIESQGGEFLYATWGRQLVKDGDRVVAVIAQNVDGDYIRVNAKAVVLSCGDFGINQEGGVLRTPSGQPELHLQLHGR